MAISTASTQLATLARFRFNAAGGETSLSGLDANNNLLSYSPGKEQVYINGALQVRGSDYTATNGTSITGLTALVANDVVEILTFSEFVIANALDQTLIDAKGDLLAGNAADSVSRLAVGSNDQVLTADSSTATGLKWATPSAGGMTLLSTTTLNGASTTISSISQSYNSLYVLIYGVTAAGNGKMSCSPNSSDVSNYVQQTGTNNTSGTNAESNLAINFGDIGWDGTSANNAIVFIIDNYTSTTRPKPFTAYGYYANSNGANGSVKLGGGFNSNTAISSLRFQQAGGNLSGGSVLVYGVK